ncbi:TIGR01777 family protein [Ursidibacter maritimus]|uniref:TIGR01777 family protein n=1 Tax=Ursidibacter maritimus TaxID=1331689 RepID=A0A949SWW1_9PAST|nr:TIGR01777 family oxidoreductase [Ursidibacter maritimus]KAE9540400.1 epimerase [Ursidibacter maritimus]MBV6524070.1 TIGR01777 family protein [Ursidibacter maritimus]MBV6524986.1 TIGR01777 family protein [Ursidibacter maritimus]MBV6527188.1 TIGR01777 family protein [Ursidibacter maritimus]MBV6529884.1 TIGR01777 family protein [Ursidibacter maritimus]
MYILITGGTGFIGTALCQELINQGHYLTVLTRQSLTAQEAVSYCQNLADFQDLNQFDAVINLAGEPIFDKPWTDQQKQKLLSSRLNITEQLVELFHKSEQPPHTFISGSATGFYGDLGFTKKYDEQTACGTKFPALLCQQWEETALQAESSQTRVCLVRTGIVLGPTGGALQKMLPLYKFGLGGKLGNGKQHWAWISRNDHIRTILFLLNNKQSQGAYNLVAPNSISNADFNQQLAKALKRPAFFNVPSFLLKLGLGERSQLLLDNQPLIPQRLMDEGFEFQHHTLGEYLSNTFLSIK